METLERLRDAIGDRYEIERELGHGGMAVVFLARDLKHDRPVAIKVMRPELASALGPARFLREIEIAARLHHPNILGLHDSGEADGLLYFVMPFVDGDSLRQRIDREGRLPLDDAVRIVREVGSALSFAHDQGLVHRDVKPENIMFQAGHAVVCDFGIAKAASEAQEKLTRTGMAVGTLTYMSPEQLSDDGRVDSRTDVYALGCVLHEMLAGEEPFPATTPQAAFAKKLIGDVPPITQLRGDVPATVQDVIVKALATSGEERYDTSERFVAALEHATTQIAVQQDARRRRNTRAARAAAGIVGVALLGAGGWWATSALAAPEFERLAVLPLVNDGGGVERAYLVEGVHEDLVLELRRAGVRMISPSAVLRYADSDASARDIATELGVDAVVQGSIGFDDDRVSVDLLLVDGVSEELIWVGSFASGAADILGLLSEMTREVTSQIGLRLTDEAEARLAAAPEIDAETYNALLEARFEWRKLTPEGLDRAEDYYRLILSRDSTVVDALLGVSRVWNVRAQQGLASAAEATDTAAVVLARAERLDPDLGRNYSDAALRFAWPRWPEGRYDEAGDAFERALEIDPADSVTRAYYAVFLLILGRVREAEDEAARAVALDPFNTLVQGLNGQFLNADGRADEAAEALSRALERDPEAPILLSTLRTTYHLLGREEEAIEVWRASYTAASDSAALGALDRGYAAGGYRSALRSVAELLVERAQTERVTPWQIGTLYMRAGMHDEALDYLARAVDEGDPNAPYLAVDGIFDPVREDPRFMRLIDRLALPTR